MLLMLLQVSLRFYAVETFCENIIIDHEENQNTMTSQDNVTVKHPPEEYNERISRHSPPPAALAMYSTRNVSRYSNCWLEI